MLSKWQREDLVDRISATVNQQVMGCDLKLALFCAACESSRRNVKAVPFPKSICYVRHSDGHVEKDARSCAGILRNLPSITALSERQALGELSDSALQLVAWLLANDTVQLKPVFLESAAARSDALKAAWRAQPDLRPHAVFEVQPPRGSMAAAPIADARVAFHGTTLDSVHSIIHVGLVSPASTLDQRTGAAFGSGIYLARDPATAFSFSQVGLGWPKSMLGAGLRCLLMCEVSPDAVEEVKGKQSRVGVLPSNYLLLKRANHVRVTHLLVYQQPLPSPRKVCGVDACTAVVLAYVGLMLAYGALRQLGPLWTSRA